MARKRRPNADDVPTDSFSDIAFQLIIFFIVTTTIAGTAGFMAELPSSEKNQQQQEQVEDKTPSVNIKDNAIFFGVGTPTPVSMAQLHGKLAELKLAEKKDDSKKIVMMETSGKVDYQTYYEVMAAITKAGGKIGIVQEVE